MPDFYDPAPVIQGDGSTYQWQNCTCASAADALDRATEGKHTTTGARVRQLTGDKSGGTTLAQADAALRAGWGVDLDVRFMIPFLDLADEVASGHGCVLQGCYRTFHVYGLAGSAAFFGNHAIYWNEVVIVRASGKVDLDGSQALIFDPLWDGRRSYVPSKQFRWVSLRMLYLFAAGLDLGGGNRVGEGHAYAALVPPTKPLVVLPTPEPTVPIDYGRNAMIVSGGIVIASSHEMSLKKGQPLYREARKGSAVVTKMAIAAAVPFIGNAAVGWKAVQVTTKNFPDKVARCVTVYVPAAAGTVKKKA
jgi:hypothetical protein